MMVSFRRGDHVVEELRRLFEREGVDAALIASGIGSLDICKLHTITKTGLPSEGVQLSSSPNLEALNTVQGVERHVNGGMPFGDIPCG